MKDINFDPNGGPLVAEIVAGQLCSGGYVLRLWMKDSNAKAMPNIEGSFTNSSPDTHALPLPVQQNDGRILEALVTCVPPSGEQKYLGALILSQDGRELGRVELDGSTDQHSVTLDLFSRLVSQ